MWPSEEFVSQLYDIANVGLVVGLIVGWVATVLVVWSGNRKEEYLKRDLARAQERAAALELNAEELHRKNLDFEKAVSPRMLEQSVTGQSLKRFADKEVTVISLNDFEPRRTAGQIRFMLRAMAGWKKSSISLRHQAGFSEGVVIHAGPVGASRPAVQALVSVLETNGIEARSGSPIPELGLNGILVIVGPKPLPASFQIKPEDLPIDARGNSAWGSTMEE